ncbi:MAG: hypothetical protein ACK4EY_07285 [Flavipsychrobacter sp.]|jgi:hypothetical protein
MKAIFATLLMIAAMATNTNTFAAKPTTVATAEKTWGVQSTGDALVIENKSAQPLDVIITGKLGEEIKTTVDKGSKSISTKELRQGRYTIKLKTPFKNEYLKLEVL